MSRQGWTLLGLLALLILFPACFSWEWSAGGGRRGWSVGQGGATGLWVLANISYAGMRAQGHPSEGWRLLAFLFGFPGTVVSWLAVVERSCRAYGITLPRPRSNDSGPSFASKPPPADSGSQETVE